MAVGGSPFSCVLATVAPSGFDGCCRRVKPALWAVVRAGEICLRLTVQRPEASKASRLHWRPAPEIAAMKGAVFRPVNRVRAIQNSVGARTAMPAGSGTNEHFLWLRLSPSLENI